MTYTRKVIQIWTKMGKIVNACAWLAELTSASKRYQIWTTQHHLIASWCPYMEMHRGKQCYMCLSLVRACPVLTDSYDFQSTSNLALAGYFTYENWVFISSSKPSMYVMYGHIPIQISVHIYIKLEECSYRRVVCRKWYRWYKVLSNTVFIFNMRWKKNVSGVFSVEYWQYNYFHYTINSNENLRGVENLTTVKCFRGYAFSEKYVSIVRAVHYNTYCLSGVVFLERIPP